MDVNKKSIKAVSSSSKILKTFGFGLAIASLTLLNACISPRNVSGDVSSVLTQLSLPEFNDALFTLEEVLDFDQITRLNNTQKDAFLKFFNDPKFALTAPSTRVATYLGLLIDQFTYSDKTFTAQQTLDNLRGNCLSLTVLSTALAELVNVDIHFQLLDQNPVYSINNNLLVSSDHLRAVLKSYPKKQNNELMGRVSYIRIDYFDTDGLSFVNDITVKTQKSLFYSNLAIEKLADQKIDSAYSYAKEALDIYPENASALNTMGILHRNRGDVATAESLYEFGARYYSKAPVFIRNYKNLLASQGRDFDLQNVLPIGQGSHPWGWVRAGKAAFNDGEYDEAVRYYKEALAIAPDIHQVYLFAGQASLAAGKKEQSKKFIIEAYKLSNGVEEQQQYKRKLLALKGRLN